MANTPNNQTPVNTKGGTTVSFVNTPQAKDDAYPSASTGLTEDSSVVVLLDVMANDLGGNAKSLWSVDNGVNNSGAMNGSQPGDLLTEDAARTAVLTNDTSLNGAIDNALKCFWPCLVIAVVLFTTICAKENDFPETAEAPWGCF